MQNAHLYGQRNWKIDHNNDTFVRLCKKNKHESYVTACSDAIGQQGRRGRANSQWDHAPLYDRTERLHSHRVFVVGQEYGGFQV
jgi:hypothetical protein